MSCLLPPDPSLEQLKNQARELLRAVHALDPSALHRLRLHLAPGAAPVDPKAATLTLAQHALAREYGFASWPRLRRFVDTRDPDERRRAELRVWIVRLVSHRDWRVADEAGKALGSAGAEGIAAVINGLTDPYPPIRKACAGWLDRYADDLCLPDLTRAALTDPVPAVRRTAIHSVSCQQCKPSPLMSDLTDLLVHVARHDSCRRVRQEAIFALGNGAPDPRILGALRALLNDPDEKLRPAVHDALRRLDPEYRRTSDAAAREAGRARAAIAAPPVS